MGADQPPTAEPQVVGAGELVEIVAGPYRPPVDEGERLSDPGRLLIADRGLDVVAEPLPTKAVGLEAVGLLV
jgi:hypothetical protein